MTTLFGLTKCSTCVKARQWLQERGIKHEFIDYRDHPVEGDTLKSWAAKLGGWEKLVNRASMTWRNLTDEQKAVNNDTEWLRLISQYPALIRRPVLVTEDGDVGVGFSDKRYGERFE